ncbi:MAG: lipid A biosynthesis lauroyl acyltransferase [Pseudomonadota bacterium]|nr:lipid A biosynthesis lauroyl acyltransferase [Pseudomonadota bacterium]
MLAGLEDRLVGGVVSALLRALAHTNPDRASDLGGAVARRLGPLSPAHRIGRENLATAFPDKDRAWIEATLRGAWDNLGRVAGEYVHLGRLWDFDPEQVNPTDFDPERPGARRIETDAAPLFYSLLHDGKPALCFAAHLANWELPAVAAAAHGMAAAALYRMPNNRAVAEQIARIRAPIMGRLIRARAEAPLEMAGALARGEHLGMLVDQHFSRGVDVTFFGRRCKANPTLARLARRFDCPVVGVRVVRLDGRRFRVEAVGPLDLPRDAEGKVDIAAASQAITTVVEGWVREHPDQWLWFHRRWR